MATVGSELVATFTGANNQGFQLGHNAGSVTNTINVTQTAPLYPRPRPSSTVPFRPDPDYVQRDIFDKLWRQSMEPASRVALVGLGGVGKSQLAITYAYQVRQKRPDTWVFWIHASSSTRFKEGFKMVAERVGVSGWNEPKADILGLVSAWLSDENNGRWVMIIDNADDIDVLFMPIDGRAENNGISTPDCVGGRSLSEYIPQSTHGSVVITSRSRDVAYRLTGRTRDILDVPPMDFYTSVVLLRKKLEGDTRDEDLNSLVRSLDGMPLAITQAAAYINQRAPRITVSKYLEELSRSDTDRAKLLQRDMGDPRRDGRASNSIITTWHVSFMYIRRARASAARLLALMSLFDREAIPESLLNGYREGNDMNVDFEDDIDMLRSYCLVGMSGDRMFEMHRLVQFSMKKWLELHGELERWQERYVDIMFDAFPTGQYENWPRCQALFPHAEAAVLYRPKNPDYLMRWAAVLYKAGWYATEYGQYKVAEMMGRESLKVRDVVLGQGHPDTLASMNNLAEVLSHQGKYEQAEEMHRRTLELKETALGKEHPDTLTSMNNLAGVLTGQGKYEQAEEIHRRTLELRETALGKEHLDTLGSMNNLAGVLSRQGRHEQAEEMHRRTLELTETALGKEHPSTLTSMNNLAEVLRDQGKYEQAEEIHRRTLELKETALGKEHPDTLTGMNNLALVLSDQSKYEQAEEMLRRILELRETALGKEHPDTLGSMNNLALVLSRQGQHEQAEVMYQRTLESVETVLGKEHPITLTSINNLAGVLSRQGKHEQAEEMHRRTIELRETALGKEHPDTLTSMNNLALVLSHQGKYEQAEEILRRTLELRETALVKEHPDTMWSVYCLAQLLSTRRRFTEAKVLYQRAVDGFQKALGEDHPMTIVCQKHYSKMLRTIEDRTTA